LGRFSTIVNLWWAPRLSVARGVKKKTLVSCLTVIPLKHGMAEGTRGTCVIRGRGRGKAILTTAARKPLAREKKRPQPPSLRDRQIRATLELNEAGPSCCSRSVRASTDRRMPEPFSFFSNHWCPVWPASGPSGRGLGEAGLAGLPNRQADLWLLLPSASYRKGQEMDWPPRSDAHPFATNCPVSSGKRFFLQPQYSPEPSRSPRGPSAKGGGASFDRRHLAFLPPRAQRG